MGLCCSSSKREEDDEYLYRQRQSSVRPVPATVWQPPRQQQTRQQVHTTPSTIQIAQTPTTYRGPVRSAAPLSVRNSQNVLIQPGTTVKILPKSVTQQISIIEVENCKSCGQSDHTKAVCRYRARLCFYCREEGHIISICPAKKRQRQRKQAQRKRQHNTKRY